MLEKLVLINLALKILEDILMQCISRVNKRQREQQKFKGRNVKEKVGEEGHK